jgi:hypothetical protein
MFCSPLQRNRSDEDFVIAIVSSPYTIGGPFYLFFGTLIPANLC